MQRGALPSLWFRQIGLKRNVGGNQGGGRGGCGGVRNHGRRYRCRNLFDLRAGSENRIGGVVGAITVVRGIVVFNPHLLSITNTSWGRRTPDILGHAHLWFVGGFMENFLGLATN